MALMEFGKPYGTLLFLKGRRKHAKKYGKSGIAPRAIDREVTEYAQDGYGR